LIHPSVLDKLPQIKAVLRKNGVRKAYLFGSVCTDKFTDKSDIDIVVSFHEGTDPLTLGDLWWDIYFSLEDLLKRPIDLLTDKSLQNPYLKNEIEKTKQDIL
jgi:predicted nucleotidyltransferase